MSEPLKPLDWDKLRDPTELGRALWTWMHAWNLNREDRDLEARVMLLTGAASATLLRANEPRNPDGWNAPDTLVAGLVSALRACIDAMRAMKDNGGVQSKVWCDALRMGDLSMAAAEKWAEKGSR